MSNLLIPLDHFMVEYIAETVDTEYPLEYGSNMKLPYQIIRRELRKYLGRTPCVYEEIKVHDELIKRHPSKIPGDTYKINEAFRKELERTENVDYTYPDFFSVKRKFSGKRKVHEMMKNDTDDDELCLRETYILSREFCWYYSYRMVLSYPNDHYGDLMNMEWLTYWEICDKIFKTMQYRKDTMPRFKVFLQEYAKITNKKNTYQVTLTEMYTILDYLINVTKRWFNGIVSRITYEDFASCNKRSPHIRNPDALMHDFGIRRDSITRKAPEYNQLEKYLLEKFTLRCIHERNGYIDYYISEEYTIDMLEDSLSDDMIKHREEQDSSYTHYNAKSIVEKKYRDRIGRALTKDEVTQIMTFLVLWYKTKEDKRGDSLRKVTEWTSNIMKNTIKNSVPANRRANVELRVPERDPDVHSNGDSESSSEKTSMVIFNEIMANNILCETTYHRTIPVAGAYNKFRKRFNRYPEEWEQLLLDRSIFRGTYMDPVTMKEKFVPLPQIPEKKSNANNRSCSIM